MSTYAHTFTITPPPRVDAPWTLAHIEEDDGATVATGVGTKIETQAIPVDASPDTPNAVEITVTQARFPLGYYRVQFEDAAGVLSRFSAWVSDPPATPVGLYCTVEQLRDELGDVTLTVSDAQALAVIETACDLIDEELGARTPDTTTGRKVTESDVEAWQWAKLTRATIKLAAALHLKPDLAVAQQWKRVSGPDFTFEGRVGSSFGPTVGVLLNQTGLRRLTTTMSRGRERWRHGFPSNADPVYED